MLEVTWRSGDAARLQSHGLNQVHVDTKCNNATMQQCDNVNLYLKFRSALSVVNFRCSIREQWLWILAYKLRKEGRGKRKRTASGKTSSAVPQVTRWHRISAPYFCSFLRDSKACRKVPLDLKHVFNTFLQFCSKYFSFRSVFKNYARAGLKSQCLCNVEYLIFL
jgi:hypothetical protein